MDEDLLDQLWCQNLSVAHPPPRSHDQKTMNGVLNPQELDQNQWKSKDFAQGIKTPICENS